MYGSRVAWLRFAIPLLLAAQSASAIVTVGPSGSGCTYTKIQDAIDYVLGYERFHPDETDPYIGVAGDYVYNEALVIDSSNVTNYIDPYGQQGAFVQIYGNYDQHCNDIPVNTTAKIGAGGGKAGNSVFEIRGSHPVRVVLNHLILTDGDVQGNGGAINFHGSGQLDITNVDITTNYAVNGGGIYASGAAGGVAVSLHSGTTIENNTATSIGGGIAFNGHGSLQIDNTQFYTNQAAFGGALYVEPDSATDVRLYDGVFMFFNTANESGGAIFIKGPTTLYANSAQQTLIGLNNAPNGYGGGVAVSGPARARLSANIFSNTAAYGGGIALFSGHGQFGDNADVTLTAPDSEHPVNVSGNTAYQTGGGIYLKPYLNNDFYTSARLCASDFRFDLNQAQEGTAIYADEDFTSILGFDKIYQGSDVHLNDPAICNTQSICVAGSSCNEINGNIAATASFQPTNGSTILIQTQGTLIANRLELQQNEGGHVIRVVDDNDKNDFDISMGDCLISDSQVTQELVYLDSNLQFFNCTLANNTIGAQHVIRVAGDSVKLTKSIIDQDVDTFDFAGNTNTANRTLLFLLTNHFDPTLTANPTLTIGTPHFVDVALRDYHLRPDSPGLDAAPADSLSADLDGYARDVDLPLVPNFYQAPTNQGYRDLGAYELQIFQLPPTCVRGDTIFCSGLE